MLEILQSDQVSMDRWSAQLYQTINRLLRFKCQKWYLYTISDVVHYASRISLTDHLELIFTFHNRRGRCRGRWSDGSDRRERSHSRGMIDSTGSKSSDVQFRWWYNVQYTLNKAMLPGEWLCPRLLTPETFDVGVLSPVIFGWKRSWSMVFSAWAYFSNRSL